VTEPKCRLTQAKHIESAHKNIGADRSSIFRVMTPDVINMQIKSMSPWVHFPCREGQRYWTVSLRVCSL